MHSKRNVVGFLARVTAGRDLLFFLFAGLLLLPATPTSAQPSEYAQAEALVMSHQWDEGLATATRLLKAEPKNPKVLNLAGLALTGKGDLAQADRYFKRCLEVNPQFVPALKNLSVNEFNQRQYGEAEKHLLEAAKSLPNDQVVRLYLGESAYKLHNYQEAADSLDRAQDFVRRSPDAELHFAISLLQTGDKQKAIENLGFVSAEQVETESQIDAGLMLVQSGLPDRALPFLEAVCHRFPDSYDMGFNLALTYIAVKQFPRAIEIGTALIGHGHETAELNNVLAEAYEGNNQTKLAVDALRRAIELAPGDEINYLDFASLCMNHRSYDAAMKVLSVGLNVHPKSSNLIFMRGVLYGMQDEYDLAATDFQLAADLAPQDNLGILGLGVTYLEKGNAEQAMKILRLRLKQSPDDPSLLYLLAEALLRNGAHLGQPQYTEAKGALEKSVKLNPQLCLPRVSLGSIYIDEEQYQEAVVQLEAARSIDPKERSAYSHLAIAYRRLGQGDKSKEVLIALKGMIEQQRSATQDKMKANEPAEVQTGPLSKAQ